MSGLFRNKRRVLMMSILFLMVFLSMPVSAQAKWKQNSNGTYSYYKNGRLQKNRWVGDYYVNSKGVRQTGWLYKSGKWYFFKPDGQVLKSTWIRSNGVMYYAGPSGSMLANGKYKIGDYHYGFDKRGGQLRGRHKIKSKTYYFDPSNGRMQTSQWIQLNNKYYYFGKNGAMAVSKWVGEYYVNKKGVRTNKVKVPENANPNVPKPSCSVESTYYTHPLVDDETLLAAIIYCEAGNQPYKGQLAVGMVIMNRVHSTLFPNTVREVIYAKSQFTPARDGSLQRALSVSSVVTGACRSAAREVLAMYEGYTTGKTMYLNTGKKQIPFNYLFFMTPAAYERLGLSSPKKKIGDHVFFEVWKR